MGAGATRLRGQPVEDPQPLDEARDDEGVREEAVEHDGHRHLVPLAPEPDAVEPVGDRHGDRRRDDVEPLRTGEGRRWDASTRRGDGTRAVRQSAERGLGRRLECEERDSELDLAAGERLVPLDEQPAHGHAREDEQVGDDDDHLRPRGDRWWVAFGDTLTGGVGGRRRAVRRAVVQTVVDICSSASASDASAVVSAPPT